MRAGFVCLGVQVAIAFKRLDKPFASKKFRKFVDHMRTY